ncbi:hypothetical protein [Hymenobacter glacialis]|uniref:Uncharacterized protein n=1 Tax=Hymenobacter glacialis TaxID=1908236 RepID=A0A1G1T3V7_9BACT|nr:hypothetical protein [Hymenobacter glacialis]OGX85553.1 hypothetical protein BEN48_01590 [Hymenobacter glacialis]
MRKRRAGLVLSSAVLGVLGLVGCADVGPAAPAPRRPLYFDVKGLVTQQIEQLAQRKAAVTKQVRVRSNPTETVRVPAANWNKELQIFLQADINKAALRGAYTVDSVALPGGLLRRTYTRLPGQPNAPVAVLTVVQQSVVAQEVTATIEQDNALFAARKRLRFQLQNGQLQRYEVVGTQKLVLFDTLHYAAAGLVE